MRSLHWVQLPYTLKLVFTDLFCAVTVNEIAMTARINIIFFMIFELFIFEIKATT
jgi:hypothetical protein